MHHNGGARHLTRRRVGQALLISATAELAALSPALVVLDRWLGQAVTSPTLSEWWCRVALLCDSRLPHYFLLIFGCCLAVPLLVWWNRHDPELVLPKPRRATLAPAVQGASPAQLRVGNAVLSCSGIALTAIVLRAASLRRLPSWELAAALLAYLLGWALREISAQRLVNAWRQNRDVLLALFLAHLALVALLADCYSGQQLKPLSALLFALAGLNLLYHRRQVHPVFWIASLALVLYTLELNAWWFSVVGDEYSFFNVAKRTLEQENLASIGSKLFLGVEVFGSHPYLSTLIQAAFMKLLGVGNFGWRFSSIYPSAMSIPLFYYVFRAFVSRQTALLASAFLAASHYLMGFSRIGYNNTQALLAMAFALAASVWALRSKGHLAYAVLGLAVGLCFYVYPAALYAVPLPFLLLLLHAPPRSRRMAGRWLVLILSVLVSISPLFLQPAYWQSKATGTLLADREFLGSATDAATRLAQALAYAAASFLYAVRETHFVAASYVDPLSGALVLLGLACLLKLARSNAAARVLLLCFGVLFLLVGGSHNEVHPSTTRMLLLLPWWALFAAVGLTWLGRQIGDVVGDQLPMTAFYGVALVAAFALNLYQAYALGPRHMDRYQNEVTLYLRMALQAQQQRGRAMPTFVFVTDPTWSPEGISDNLHPVYFPTSPPALMPVVVTETALPSEAQALIADPNTLVVIKPWADEGWKGELGLALGALGKVPCDITTLTGRVRFQLWHSGGWGMLCG